MNSHNNKVTVLLESRSQNEALARTLVAAFITPLDPSMGELTDIKTAVSEAVTNAIIHGYGEKPDGEIKLTLTLDEGKLTVQISDNGIGISDINQARTALYTSKPEIERAGMGFTVMESFMDEVTVESTPGVGTTVIMVKTLAVSLKASK
jgi:stage II sporulation protein AB (anti-sigma F factor)